MRRKVPKKRAALRIRIVLREGVAVGPGKIDLLAGIAELGSISAAGRAMGMSYQRAWSLVDELNGMFRLPLVSASRGGAQRGGATVTETGQLVLERYRAIERGAAEQFGDDLDAIAGLARREGPDIRRKR